MRDDLRFGGEGTLLDVERELLATITVLLRIKGISLLVFKVDERLDAIDVIGIVRGEVEADDDVDEDNGNDDVDNRLQLILLCTRILVNVGDIGKYSISVSSVDRFEGRKKKEIFLCVFRISSFMIFLLAFTCRIVIRGQT